MSVSAKLINSLIIPSQVIHRSFNTSSSFNLFKYCLRIEFALYTKLYKIYQ